MRVDRDPMFRPNRIGPVTLLDSEALGQLRLLTRDLTQLATPSPVVKTSEDGFSIGGAPKTEPSLPADGAPLPIAPRILSR